MEQLTQQLQAESRQKEEVRSEVQGRQALLDRKSTTIADLQATLLKAQQQVSRADETVRGKHTQIASLEAQREQLTEQLTIDRNDKTAALSAADAAAKAAKAGHDRRLATERERYTALHQDLEGVQEQLLDECQAVRDVGNQLTQAQAELGAGARLLQDKTSESDLLKIQVDQLTQQLQQKQGQLDQAAASNAAATQDVAGVQPKMEKCTAKLDIRIKHRHGQGQLQGLAPSSPTIKAERAVSQALSDSEHDLRPAGPESLKKKNKKKKNKKNNRNGFESVNDSSAGMLPPILMAAEAASSISQVLRSGGNPNQGMPGFPASAHVSHADTAEVMEGVVHSAAQQVMRSGGVSSKGTPGSPAATHVRPYKSRGVGREAAAAAGQEAEPGVCLSNAMLGSPAPPHPSDAACRTSSAHETISAKQRLQDAIEARSHLRTPWVIPTFDMEMCFVNEEIGHGVNGSVVKMTNPLWPRCFLKKAKYFTLLAEAAMVARMRHPSIVRVHALLNPPEGSQDRAEGLGYMVMQELGLSLDRVLLTRGRNFTVREVVTNMCQVAAALAVIHYKGLVHGDLHKGNIVCALDGQGWVVGDFGNAAWRFQPDGTDTMRHQMMLARGLEAPEAAAEFLKHQQYTPRSPQDMWAFGQLLLELLGGDVPTEHLLVKCTGDTLQYAAQLLSPERGALTYADQVKYPVLMDDEREALEPVIRGCFNLDPFQRCSADEVVKSLFNLMISKHWLKGVPAKHRQHSSG